MIGKNNPQKDKASFLKSSYSKKEIKSKNSVRKNFHIRNSLFEVCPFNLILLTTWHFSQTISKWHLFKQMSSSTFNTSNLTADCNTETSY